MSQIEEYQVIREPYENRFNEILAEKTKEGWILHGEIQYIPGIPSGYFRSGILPHWVCTMKRMEGQ